MAVSAFIFLIKDVVRRDLDGKGYFPGGEGVMNKLLVAVALVFCAGVAHAHQPDIELRPDQIQVLEDLVTVKYPQVTEMGFRVIGKQGRVWFFLVTVHPRVQRTRALWMIAFNPPLDDTLFETRFLGIIR